MTEGRKWGAIHLVGANKATIMICNVDNAIVNDDVFKSTDPCRGKGLYQSAIKRVMVDCSSTFADSKQRLSHTDAGTEHCGCYCQSESETSHADCTSSGSLRAGWFKQFCANS